MSNSKTPELPPRLADLAERRAQREREADELRDRLEAALKFIGAVASGTCALNREQWEHAVSTVLVDFDQRLGRLEAADKQIQSAVDDVESNVRRITDQFPASARRRL